MAIIYKISNTENDKVYIGFTSTSIKHRWSYHVRDYKNQEDKRLLYVEMRRIGIDKFKIEQLNSHEDENYALTVLEPMYVNKFDSYLNGYNSSSGGEGSTKSTVKGVEVDLYTRDKVYIKTFNSISECARELSSDNGTVSHALSRCKQGRSSKVKGFYVCPTGYTPSNRVYNPAGIKAAILAQTGKKRPKHSEAMTKHARTKPARYVIPEGEFILEDACKFYGRDFVREWCRNSHIVVSKMMIIKSKALSLETHSHWVGKTRKECGFYYKET